MRRPHRLFCFGLGYTALALAASLEEAGWTIAGTCRDPGKAATLAGRAIEIHRFERGRPLDPAALAGATHVLSSIPPDEAGDPVLDQHGADLAAATGLAWIGYLSTTGVYGDRDGGWVDERSAPAPTGARGRRRVAAETGWFDLWHRHGLPVHLFRLAGIYGPGRNALEQVRAGIAKRVDLPGHVFSRIHVADIVATLCASMARPNPGAIYNVCDDQPASGAEVVAYASALLGMAPPPLLPLESAGLSPMALSFYRDNKRVRNQRIKHELGVVLQYPDYRAGLAALLAADA